MFRPVLNCRDDLRLDLLQINNFQSRAFRPHFANRWRKSFVRFRQDSFPESPLALFLFQCRSCNSNRRKYKFCRFRRQQPSALNASRRIYSSNRNREMSPEFSVFCRSVLVSFLLKFSPREFVGFGEIKPILPVFIRIKCDAVRIFQAGHIFYDFAEFSRFFVEIIKNINFAFRVVGQIKHIGDENSAIRCFGKKSHAFQTFRRRNYFIICGQIQIETFAVLQIDFMRNVSFGCAKRSSEQLALEVESSFY